MHLACVNKLATNKLSVIGHSCNLLTITRLPSACERQYARQLSLPTLDRKRLWTATGVFQPQIQEVWSLLSFYRTRGIPFH